MVLPVIDLSPFLSNGEGQGVTGQIHDACRNTGFFYITGHGIDDNLQQALEEVSHAFFALDVQVKMQCRMSLGGRAWRGYFPVGGELTSGKPDLKEGLYFGEELSTDDPRVQHGLPMHGANLFPSELPEMRTIVLDFMSAMTELGHHLMRAISLSLGLKQTYFTEHYTTDPLILFRIFHYPAPSVPAADIWGVGEHTDYGLLTILKQDSAGGLQIKRRSGWIDAPYIPGTFICNIGDMLDRLTRGYYRSTPHRVLNTSGKGRYSFPFFFDPGFDAQLQPVSLEHIEVPPDDADQRWDKTSVHDFEGTYGNYILGKVAKVFPELGKKAL